MRFLWTSFFGMSALEVFSLCLRIAVYLMNHKEYCEWEWGFRVCNTAHVLSLSTVLGNVNSSSPLALLADYCLMIARSFLCWQGAPWMEMRVYGLSHCSCAFSAVFRKRSCLTRFTSMIKNSLEAWVPICCKIKVDQCFAAVQQLWFWFFSGGIHLWS